MADEREKGAWSSTSYESTARGISSSGESVTHLGEQRQRQGLGLDRLVDPRTHGVVRESLNLLVPQSDSYVLPYGIALPVKTALDTTGSMGGNVDIAFKVIPTAQRLLVGPGTVLSRYHVHFATSVIQDIDDRYPHQHTEFEVDNRIEEQMRLLVPERQGGDAAEDYQLDLWYTAYRINATIWNYGLKGYYFIVGDERGRDECTPSMLERVYHDSRLLQSPLEVEELGRLVLQKWHAFYLQVGDDRYDTHYWSRIFGHERVIHLPRTEDIAAIQAVVIGLTEGVLSMQTAYRYLMDVGRFSQRQAQLVAGACGNIPFNQQPQIQLPGIGAIFANRTDVWPIGWQQSPATSTNDEITWQL